MKIFFYTLTSILTFSIASVFGQTFTNPLRASGADPFMVYYNGYYYLTYTGDGISHVGGTAIEIVKASSLNKLYNSPANVVWSDKDGTRSNNMWAPELHRLKGENGFRWYLYYTAGPMACCNGQRIHVLESEGDDPLGPYNYKAQLTPEYAIDATVLSVGDDLYLLYSQIAFGNHLNIERMANPYTVSGPSVTIASPTYGWEKIAGRINEAPAALVRNGKIFVTYSFNDCTSQFYGLGMLTADQNSNLLDPTSWKKSDNPVLQRNAYKGVYGPGHNSFFKSPDNTQDWILYHANVSAFDGCTNKRSPRAQMVRWNADGTPEFGTPVAINTELKLPSGDPENQSTSPLSPMALRSSASEIQLLSVYPNPPFDVMNFEYTSDIDQNIAMKLLDQNGKVMMNIYDGPIAKGATVTKTRNTNEVSKGTYFLQLSSNLVNKFIKILVNGTEP